MRSRKSLHFSLKVYPPEHINILFYSCDGSCLAFRNYYTIDMLLRIVEEFSDELKILGSGALNMLSRDKDVQGLFKQFGACEKLIGQLVST